MSPGPVTGAVSVLVLLQSALLVGGYLLARPRVAAATGRRAVRTFRTGYAVAAALLTAGPPVGLAGVGRVEPYVTPLGTVEPLAVANAGMRAWLAGVVAFLATFVATWLVQQRAEVS